MAPQAPAPARTAPSGLIPRQFAASLLKAVLLKKQPLDETFNAKAGGPFAGLDARDRAFARAMTAVSLRRLGQIEDILRRFVNRPLHENAADVHLVLVLGVAQLVFLRAAPHAAISLAVDQVRTLRNGERFAGLVNAVLRRVSREGIAIAESQDEALLNTPDWLMRRWVADYGQDAARRIALAHLEEPPLDLTVKAGASQWAERLGGVETLPWSVRLRSKGRIEELAGYEEGAWWVQDVAASLPARLLGDVAGRRVADLCAAPGGKTAQFAAQGASVVAVDHSAARLKRLAANLARLRLEAEIVEADAAAWTPDEKFDAVLLDAPCSSTGTIRRNPDIPHTKSDSDVEALAKLQMRLIAHAPNLLKPGGILVFCTCSLASREGEAQADAVLRSGLPLVHDPLQPGGWLNQEWIDARGNLRTLPFHGDFGEAQSGMDGFFASRFRRTA